MSKITLFFCCLLLVTVCSSQTLSSKLQKAFAAFENDSQMKHAISSLYVIDAVTGNVVFDKNSQVGLAGASTQKVITATTAFELLGKDYRYKTDFGYRGKISGDTLMGTLFIHGCGDPTFGSWRYEVTKDTVIFDAFLDALKKLNINRLNCSVEYNYKDFSFKDIPDGWIWEDIGNYYGAPATLFNWKENQYDIVLRSGEKIGTKVQIQDPDSLLYKNELISAGKNSGDNAYVYPKIDWNPQLIAGTIPVNEPAFKISASDLTPIGSFSYHLSEFLKLQGIRIRGLPTASISSMERFSRYNEPATQLLIHYSPSLDSIIYWFLKKSINLYGEALIKTFAYEKNGFGSTDTGVNIVKEFWKEKGIEANELNICDGSGLSPLNRITTHAQVQVLKYAKSRDWFPYFYDALPEYNGMKMKSGTIRDVKGFCGYQKSSDGKEYIFSFLVNNYSGSTQGVVNKMYNVLDLLK